MKLEPIIGLEIHVQLKTKSKMFCGCANVADGAAPPNSVICPICTGQPGALPSPNAAAIEMGVKASLALGCKITPLSKFDRKHYFYPDLPKGYQISQYDQPVGVKGAVPVTVAGVKKTIRITRLHLEEDAAKLWHDPAGHTLVDFNRAGTPLAEIVTEPDFESAAEAKAFLTELRLIMRTIGVSDAEMEKGQLRCDANISLRPVGEKNLHAKTEIKNLNSFRSVERALEYEMKRQTKLWEEGLPPTQTSTRGWDDVAMKTVDQRRKEEAHDYRYFPEPDIPPMNLKTLEKKIKPMMPELPEQKRQRFVDEYSFSLADAKILTADSALADFTEHVFSELIEWLRSLEEVEGSVEDQKKRYNTRLAQIVGSWITTRLLGTLEERKGNIRTMKITPENFAELIALVYERKVNQQSAMIILETMLEAGKDPTQIMEDKGLGAVTDDALIDRAVQNVLKAFKPQVEQYKNGKKEVFQFLVGMVMKETEGKADVTLVREKLEGALG
ncbi:MAG: Glu-tRNAGln amidotransferase subunit B [Candidatus Magasanikbacteria bacterium]|nr:Glu-tRNAGln amidotransferase subunit B [Candidatus Magasanikbacteria bacterium]